MFKTFLKKIICLRHKTDYFTLLNKLEWEQYEAIDLQDN
jgi:hypothetical protein